jgi:hypothetical protein
MKKVLFYLLATTILSYSCNSSSNQPNICTLNDANLSGVYKIISEKIQSDSSATPIENISNWAECERDNIYNLSLNRTFLFDDGAQACFNPPIHDNGTWALAGDTLKLAYDLGYNDTLIISNFNCTTFQTVNYNPSSGQIRTITYEKQ